MLEKTKGVVLHALRYKDDSLIVDIYTELHGTVSFLVKVPRTRRATLHTQLLRPLNILDIGFDYRPARQLQQLKEAHLAVAYTSLDVDAVKLTLSIFLSEFLHHALRHEASNPPLLQFLIMSLRWLDLADVRAAANFHLVFMIQLTRHLGVWPDVQELGLGTEEAALVPLFMRLQYGTMHLMRMTREQRARALSIILTYYRQHVAEFPELRSVDILAEVLR